MDQAVAESHATSAIREHWERPSRMAEMSAKPVTLEKAAHTQIEPQGAVQYASKINQKHRTSCKGYTAAPGLAMSTVQHSAGQPVTK